MKTPTPSHLPRLPDGHNQAPAIVCGMVLTFASCNAHASGDVFVVYILAAFILVSVACLVGIALVKSSKKMRVFKLALLVTWWAMAFWVANLPGNDGRLQMGEAWVLVSSGLVLLLCLKK